MCICSAQGLWRVRHRVPDCLSFSRNIYALIWETWWEPIASCFRERLSDNLAGGITSLCETLTPGPCCGDRAGGNAAPGVALGSGAVRSTLGPPAGSCQPGCYTTELLHKLSSSVRGGAGGTPARCLLPCVI